MFPVVAKGEAILRFTLNARHTEEDLRYTLDVLIRLGKKWDILHRSAEEICEVGRRVRHGNLMPAAPREPAVPAPREPAAPAPALAASLLV
jgi:hypothetical protein